MGVFSRLFSCDDGNTTSRVRQDSDNHSHVRGDKYERVDGGHVHRSYDLDTASGSYREYTGGEKSGDRSYNK